MKYLLHPLSASGSSVDRSLILYHLDSSQGTNNQLMEVFDLRLKYSSLVFNLHEQNQRPTKKPHQKPLLSASLTNTTDSRLPAMEMSTLLNAKADGNPARSLDRTDDPCPARIASGGRVGSFSTPNKRGHLCKRFEPASTSESGSEERFGSWPMKDFGADIVQRRGWIARQRRRVRSTCDS